MQSPPFEAGLAATSSIKCGASDVLELVSPGTKKVWKLLPLCFGEMAHCKKSDHFEAIMMMGSPPGGATWKEDGAWSAPADVPGR